MRRATTLGAKPEGSRERLAQASSDQNARRGRSSGGGEDERDGRSECGNEVGKHRLEVALGSGGVLSPTSHARLRG
jgi:hypothetical protein